MFKVGLDAVNRTAQFQLRNSLSAFTLDILGIMNSEDGGAKKLDFKKIGDKMNVRLELIRKNQPNVTLTDLSLDELAKVTDILYRGGVGNTIPVALGENLILNDDAYLQVTLEWKSDVTITKMDVFENRVIGNTDKPLSIKSVAIDEQNEVNTEFYGFAVFSEDITSLETIRTDVGDDGVAVSQKQEMSYDYMKLLSFEEKGVVFVTEKDQKVKFYGAGKVYLVSA